MGSKRCGSSIDHAHMCDTPQLCCLSAVAKQCPVEYVIGPLKGLILGSGDRLSHCIVPYNLYCRRYTSSFKAATNTL